MSNQIERLHYYDGEYLRSFDFTAEQAYHIEMRRRLNHRLHLHGIAYGLHLITDQDSPPPPAVPFFSIAPGMAIDEHGREIFVPAPYSLSAENVLNRAGLTVGDNELWLCYQETQTGLPAAGYRDCNEKNQYTRWQEAFHIDFKPLNPTKNSYIAPDCGGVRLGVVTLDSTNGWQIVAVNDKKGRTYVGIRAQRVIAADEEAESYDPAAKPPLPVPDELLPGYLDVLPGVFNRGNVFVKKNLVVGDDFVLNDPALPNPIPPTGNVKITQDLFLNGDFYGAVAGKWFVLKDYIQMLMPVVVTGVATIDFNVPGAIPVPPNITGTVTVPVDSKLPQVTQPLKIFVALNRIDCQDPNTLNTDWFTSADPGAKKPLTVSVAGPNIPPAPAPSINLTISATMGPLVKDAANKIQLPVTSVSVSYFVVFTP